MLVRHCAICLANRRIVCNNLVNHIASFVTCIIMTSYADTGTHLEWHEYVCILTCFRSEIVSIYLERQKTLKVCHHSARCMCVCVYYKYFSSITAMVQAKDYVPLSNTNNDHFHLQFVKSLFN